MFDSTARFLIDRNLAREITKEEAIEVLRLSEEAGLVHTCTNSQDRLAVICNCCPCCCMVLNEDGPGSRTPTRSQRAGGTLSVDAELCAGCGTVPGRAMPCFRN